MRRRGPSRRSMPRGLRSLRPRDREREALCKVPLTPSVSSSSRIFKSISSRRRQCNNWYFPRGARITFLIKAGIACLRVFTWTSYYGVNFTPLFSWRSWKSEKKYRLCQEQLRITTLPTLTPWAPLLQSVPHFTPHGFCYHWIQGKLLKLERTPFWTLKLLQPQPPHSIVVGKVSGGGSSGLGSTASRCNREEWRSKRRTFFRTTVVTLELLDCWAIPPSIFFFTIPDIATTSLKVPSINTRMRHAPPKRFALIGVRFNVLAGIG